MAEFTQTESSPNLSSLVGGIVKDAQELIREEIALAKQEFRQEMHQIKTAGLSFGIGIGVGALGSVLCCFFLVHLLHWLTSPAGADPASLPLWLCYGIVAGLFLVVGSSLVWLARHKVQQIDIVPPRTVETMKENVQWIKSQT
jgi:hypothetical protein